MELVISWSPKFSRMEVKDGVDPKSKEAFSMEQVFASVKVEITEADLLTHGDKVGEALTARLWPQVFASVEYQKEQLRAYYNGGSVAVKSQNTPEAKNDTTDVKEHCEAVLNIINNTTVVNKDEPEEQAVEQKKQFHSDAKPEQNVEELVKNRDKAKRAFVASRDSLGWSQDTGRLFIATMSGVEPKDIDFRSLKTETIVEAAALIAKVDGATHTKEDWLGAEDNHNQNMKELIDQLRS